MIALPQYPPPPDAPGPDRVFAFFYLFALALAIAILLLPREWTRRIARIAFWNRERDE